MIIPTFHYDDAPAAIDFLERAFGFERHAVYEGEGGLVVIDGDVDAHCERARAAGADVFREPTDQDYGGRDYSCRDPEANVWSFGTYAPS
jgi:uncharacterized glyoxalase superfamily protein PhnB